MSTDEEIDTEICFHSKPLQKEGHESNELSHDSIFHVERSDGNLKHSDTLAIDSIRQTIRREIVSPANGLPSVSSAEQQTHYRAHEEPSMRQRLKGYVHGVLEDWYRLESFETREFYEKIGVRFFKKWMPTSGDVVYNKIWRALGNPPQIRTGGDRYKDVQSGIEATKQLELIHLVGFTAYSAIGAIFLASSIASYGVTFSAPLVLGSFMTLANIPANIYPIAVQRYNRIRMKDFLARHESIIEKNQNLI